MHKPPAPRPPVGAAMHSGTRHRDHPPPRSGTNRPRARTWASPRAHARILTLLGEELIADTPQAVVELVKNASDADAEHVVIAFEDTESAEATIRIRDDGTGMTEATARAHWTRPGSPAKLRARRQGRARTAGKNRPLQGEKGIGHLAVLRLGRHHTLTTRAPGEATETVLTCDLTPYDDSLSHRHGDTRALFLDELELTCATRPPRTFPDETHGVELAITHLREPWTAHAADALATHLAQLTRPVAALADPHGGEAIQIEVRHEGKTRYANTDDAENTRKLLEEKALLHIHARYDAREKTLTWHERENGPETVWHEPCDYACGTLTLQLAVFDMDADPMTTRALLPDERTLVRNHGVGLYRDGMRVHPYGEPGRESLLAEGGDPDGPHPEAVLGWVSIGEKDNPELRDNTARDALVDNRARRGLARCLRDVLDRAWRTKRATAFEETPRLQASASLRALARTLDGADATALAQAANRIADTMDEQKSSEEDWMARLAPLAAAGISAEMGSHDFASLFGHAVRHAGRLRQTTEETLHQAERSGANPHEAAETRKSAHALEDTLQKTWKQFEKTQVLFKSHRRRFRDKDVERLVDQCIEIMRPQLRAEGITLTKKTTHGRLRAPIHDAAVMLTLINLFENARYWLACAERRRPQITVAINARTRTVTVSDNGPGIDPLDAPFIFNPGYGGKGECGRGVGLTLSRRALERNGHTLTLEPAKRGARFQIRFATTPDAETTGR